MHQRKIDREQIASPKEDIEDLELPDSDRQIYSIEKINAEPLAVKNARLFMNEPQTITKIASLSSQSIPISSISPLRVRSQISPGLVQLAKGRKKKSKNSVPKQRFSAQSPGILKGPNFLNGSSRSGSQKRVSFNLDTSKYGNCQVFGQIQKRKKNTMIEMLRQF